MASPVACIAWSDGQLWGEWSFSRVSRCSLPCARCALQQGAHPAPGSAHAPGAGWPPSVPDDRDDPRVLQANVAASGECVVGAVVGLIDARLVLLAMVLDGNDVHAGSHGPGSPANDGDVDRIR